MFNSNLWQKTTFLFLIKFGRARNTEALKGLVVLKKVRPEVFDKASSVGKERFITWVVYTTQMR